MLEKGNILTLSDDNEYVVVDQFTHNGNYYIYLVDMNKNDNIMYAKLVNEEVIELTDEEELKEIIKIVRDNLHK